MANTALFKKNFPELAQAKCGGNCSGGCTCQTENIDFGEVFSDQALFKLDKRTDDLCSAYEKINKNFAMLANWLFFIEKAMQKQKIAFSAFLPVAYAGNFVFNTTDQRLYIWNEATNCYIPVYGTNSILPEDGDKIGEVHVPENCLPNLQHLRNIAEGVDVNHFTNMYGLMEVLFVDRTPDCPVGLFIFDKEECVLKVWSSEDGEYYNVYGCNSVTKDNYQPKPTQTGPSQQIVSKK